MTAQFTPGPWEADEGDGQYFGIFADALGSDAVAYLCEPHHPQSIPLPRERGHEIVGQPKRMGEAAGRYGEYTRRAEHEANARLIAAAPKMYETLEWIRKIADANLEQDEKLRSQGARTLMRIADKAEEMMAEARGDA